MDIAQIFGLSPRRRMEPDKEVGIEIEVEGIYLPRDLDGRRYNWAFKQEGSLRGDECGEYVLRKPIERSKVFEEVEKLGALFKQRDSRIFGSNRTSVHVHINVQDWNIVEVINFVILYLIYEDILVRYCGESREGNLFCLRSKDAEYLYSALFNVGTTKNYENLQGNNLRYASINVEALSKFGSLEFRSMRGTVDPSEIEEWVNILLSLKDFAKETERPEEILHEISVQGITAYSNKVFGEYYGCLFKEGDEQVVMEGVRRVQYIGYCCDWMAHLQSKPKAILQDDIENPDVRRRLRR